MSENRTTIIGYGSLLSQVSARRTCPNLTNFRPGCIRGFRRHFNLVSVSAIKRGFADPHSLDLAAVSCCPHESDTLFVSLFDVSDAELSAYYQREARYRFARVEAFEFGGMEADVGVEGVICLENSDDSEVKEDEYEGRLWRSDIFPIPQYLKLCLTSAFELGGTNFLDNFLDTSYLADRQTVLREFLKHQNLMEMIKPSK